MITFCRLRPACGPTGAWADARRLQGTTVAEMADPSEADAGACLQGGLLPVAVGPSDAPVAGWVVGPSDALLLAGAGEPGWRITVVDSGPPESVIEALARSSARFLRTRRSRVPAAARLASLPGIDAVVSVFVDDVAAASAAVAAGAGDLLLRDWDTERLAELREALGGRLLERTALPPGTGFDDVSDALAGPLLAAYLNQVDGAGAVRPGADWAPGRETAVPKPPHRFSAQWSDPAWRGAHRQAGDIPLPPDLEGILERALAGLAPDRTEVRRLFAARGDEVEAIAATADRLRERACGDVVTYVVNRNINYTNQCTYGCGFCAFSRGPRSLRLRDDPYLLEVHEVARRAREAEEAGATEVCLQGGIHPGFTGGFYLEVVRAVKEAAPGIHVHGFTPLEVWQGAATLGLTVTEFLRRLGDAGLGTLPGTAAEILDDRVRRHLCPDKITTAEWSHVMLEAHRLGIRSTATVMFGHVDGPDSWAEHIEVIRRIQRQTGGFTEFVPLPFVHMGAPIYLQGRARPGPTWDEVVLMHAVARIALDGLIPNVQASWVKLGVAGAAALLGAGCNDLGGTLMEESISRAAGASHGQRVGTGEIEAAVDLAGRVPALRNTLYETSALTREA